MSEVTIRSGVACLLPPTTEITVKQVGGFMAPEIRGGLQELTVAFASSCRVPGGGGIEVEEGQKVFVAVESLAAFPWSKAQYQIDNTTFIIVPAEFIVGAREWAF